MLLDRTRAGATRRLVLALAVAALLAFVVIPWWSGPHAVRVFTTSSSPRVAVYEPTPYHGEVFGALLAALQAAGVNATFYAHRPDWDFAAVLADIHPAPPLAPEALAAAIGRNEYDVVVLNTCDPKFQNRNHGVIAALEGSTARVVCQIHEGDFFGAAPEDSAQLAPWLGRLDLLTLGAHTAKAVRRTLERFAQHTRSGAWERVPVHHWAPVFDLPEAVVPAKVATGRFDKAAIIGRVWQTQRDYEGVMRELEQAILENPGAWGYTVQGSPPRLVAADQPFTLHLIGMEGHHELTYPPLLVDEDSPVVHVHAGVSNVEYYRLIRGMVCRLSAAAADAQDIVLPAFNTEQYYDYKSSASVPAAIMCETPLLATRRMLESYTYLQSPAYIPSPVGTSAVRALEQLRAGEAPWAAEFGAVPPPAVPPADAFLGASRWPWAAGTSYARYTAALRARNAEIFGDIMRA
ncbi:hypothetical protein Q8F55_004279 [Vanrija albida]|uniref:Glycosyltransferase family 1 protein n=1 Tax=Vanrija albida TaxID=181172 RepID=A0ABR3Q6A9_9TREE